MFVLCPLQKREAVRGVGRGAKMGGSGTSLLGTPSSTMSCKSTSDGDRWRSLEGLGLVRGLKLAEPLRVLQDTCEGRDKCERKYKR
jgi:hypothetical protein